jgi:transposase
MEVLTASDAKRDMTERLVKWAGRQSLKRTFASVAEEAGLDEKTVRNIFRDHVKELEAKFRFKTPQWMGIDEIFLTKPRCVIANIKNNTIVDMLVNRNKETVIKYLTKMEDHDQVQYFAMDMWAPYRDAVIEVMPQAKIVIDKFHVVRMANEAIEKARKGLRAELSLKERRGLMHDRFVLLKRESELDVANLAKLDRWVAAYPILAQAYRIKEDFYAIYEASNSREDALQRYENWRRGITPELHPYFSDLIRAFGNWQPWILNYFDHPITNAYTESLNSLIRVMNRLGRGYSFEALRAKILFTEGIHAQKKSRPKFERQSPEVLFAMCQFTANRVGHENHDEDPEQKLNFGADIATLIRMIESGQI